MKRAVSIVLTLVLVMSLFAGCGQSAETPAADSPAAAGTTAITVALSTVGNNLDPSVANQIDTETMMSHVYDKLIEVDENFALQPGVAVSWEQPDATTYVFTIGDGFVFHNGEALEMEDVLYSVTRLENIAQTASLYAKMDSVSVEGNQLIITTKEADSGFIRDLSEVPVVNKSYCEEAGEGYANAPIGTGPYTVAAYTPGEKVVLSAWADYPGGKPAIDTITFLAIEDDTTSYMALEAGDVDFSGVASTDYERARANDSVIFYEGDTTTTAFVSMNTQAAPFDNEKVRLAMAYAYNKEGYLAVKGSNFYTIDSMFPNMTEYYNSSDYTITYDLAKAKALLEEAGYNESNPLSFQISLYNEDPVMQAYQADLASIGVKVEMVTQEFGVFLDNMCNMNFQMLTGSWGDTTGNPLTAAECYWSGSFGSQNISFYQNDRCDELYNIAKTSVDPDEVIAACHEIQDIAWQACPMFPTFGRTEAYAYDKGLSGVVINPSGTLSFRDATFEG